MTKLSDTWLTDNIIDFEYKKYVLLDYLQKVNEHFEEHKLFPELSDLMVHHDALLKIKQNKDHLLENFPKRVKGVDIDRMLIIYQKLVEDDELMRHISNIIQYSIPELDDAIARGKELYSYAENNILIDQIGLLPIYQNEGYLLLTGEHEKQLSVYRYTLSRIIHHKQQLNMIRTKFLFRDVKTISNTFQKIKSRLIKTFVDLPNPATFLVTSKRHFPINETMLPMAKQLLLKNASIS